MNHPPLCPKTPEVFALDGALWWWTVQGLDPSIKCCDETPASDRFVARYQACAWEDRAKLWWKLYLREMPKWHENSLISEAHALCLSNARAWREWEKRND